MMKYPIFSLFVFLLVACSESKKEVKAVNWNTEKSIRLNANLAEEQDLEIKFYLARFEKKYHVVNTGTGLRKFTIKEGKGDLPKIGQIATIIYSVKLMNGTNVYETERANSDQIKIDNSQVESGLQEGLKRMKTGEIATLVFPSHLAHGLVGDMNKIPPLSALIVNVELKTISN